MGPKPNKKEEKKEHEKNIDEPDSKHPQQSRSSHENQQFKFADIKKKQRELSICPNCQKKFESLNSHFARSLICKQTSNQGVTSNVSQNSITRKRTSRPVMKSTTFGTEIPKKKARQVTEKQSGQTKCEGCEKEVKNIVNHVKKSFCCKNMNGISEKLDENLCSDDKFAPNETKHNKTEKKT